MGRRFTLAQGKTNMLHGLTTSEVLSIFTDEIEVDFSSYTGMEPGWMKLPADLWTESLKGLFLGLDATQHSMSNPRITIRPATPEDAKNVAEAPQLLTGHLPSSDRNVG